MKARNDERDEDWFSSWFGQDYLAVYPRRNEAEAEQQVAFLTELLQLDRSSSILDIACGTGRHLSAFCRRGLSACGVDLSVDLLQQAAAAGLPVVRADMRALPFDDGQFSALFSFFTSFGYFPTDEEHLQVLSEWARVAAAGAKLVIDCANRDAVIATLVPLSREEGPAGTITQKRTLSSDGTRVEKTIEIDDRRSGTRTYRESVRLFSVTELTDLVQRAGFEVKRVLGGFSDADYNDRSNRMVLIAAR